MNPREQEIYNGLKSIGQEIAAFFEDALKIATSDYGTKPYLLSHLSREIESGLRDILTPKTEEGVIICEKCSQQINRKIGHKESIIKSLGLSEENEFVRKWHRTAQKFPRFAHRHGAWKTPREKESFDNLWNDFVDILEFLVGSYYSLSDRIDTIIAIDTPNKVILSTIKNLFQKESIYVYFFNNLKSTNWLKYLKDEGYFEGSKNPELIPNEEDPNMVSIPYWSVLNYLEHISLWNFENPKEEISELLLSVIDDISCYRKVDGSRIENFRTDYNVFKLICELPINLISRKHIEFIETTFDSKIYGSIGFEFGKLIDRLILIEDKSLLIKCVDVLLKYRILDSYITEKVVSIFRDYEHSSIISEYKDKLITACGVEMAQLIKFKIENLIESEKTTFNNVTIPTIEPHEQSNFSEKYECQVVYLLRDCLEKLPVDYVYPTLFALLNKEHPIFKRVALHTINVRYNEFNDVFWSWSDNPLSIPLIKHELYELIKQNSNRFSDTQINDILNWIETREYFKADDFEGNEEQLVKATAYRKKEWLTALIETKNEHLQKVYDELNRINNAEVDHPGFDLWFSSSYGYSSPLTEKEIEEKSIEELIDFTKAYSEEKKDLWGDSIEGLSSVISTAICSNHEKFSVDCNALINAPSIFLYSWINGINQVIRNEIAIGKVSTVISIIDKIIGKSEFWKQIDENDKYSNWFLTDLLRFIESILNRDFIELKSADLDLIKKILFETHKNDHSPVDEFENLPMTVLNNTKGKIYTSLFELSLRIARFEKKEVDRWDADIKELLNSEIDKLEENNMLYCVLGQFLPNICFLDLPWLIDKYKVLFSWDRPNNWDSIMIGFLYYHNRPYKELFSLLHDNSDYELALIESERFQNAATTNLINQICSAYLSGLDDLKIETPVVQTIITTNNESIISAYIYFFWSPKVPIPENLIGKIKQFWKNIFDYSSDLMNPVIDKIRLSGCCKFLKNFTTIDDEIYSWLMFSVKYLNVRDRYSIFEALEKNIESSPEKVADLLIEIFGHEVTHDISRGKITKMVQTLYNKGQREKADRICNMHGEKGIHFLREVFLKNKTG